MVDKLLFICLGNHSKAFRVREHARVVISSLQDQEFLTSDELAVRLSLPPKSEASRKQFERIVNPLRGKNPLRVRTIRKFKESGKVYWELSPKHFHKDMMALKHSIVRKLSEEDIDVGPPLVNDIILDRIAYICHGNHSKALRLRKQCKELLALARMKGDLSTQDIMGHFGLDFNTSKGRCAFHRLIKPLSGDNVLGLQFMVQSDPSDGEHWNLSPVVARATFDLLTRDLKQTYFLGKH